MERVTRNRLLILVIDGLLGAMIGGVSLGSQSAMSPIVHDHRLEMFAGATAVMAALFGIPMFLATVALAPVLLAVLRRWSQKPASSYYLRSALAGVAFGAVACAAVGFVFGLITPFLPQPGGTTLTQRLMLLAGAPFFLALGCFFMSFVFWQQVIVAGLGFGLFNGWWLRRHLS